MNVDKFKIYTDGSSLGNPGPGGWAAIIIFNGIESTIYGSYSLATNNQMELLAAIKAIEKTPLGSHIQLFSDSSYVVLGASKYIYHWHLRNWGKIKNINMWKYIFKLINQRVIQWFWIGRNDGNVYNIRVDYLAKKAAKMQY